MQELPRLLVFLLALLTAWSASSNGFVWDDRSAILSNRDAQDSALSSVFANDFWGTHIRSEDSHKSYRPLTVLSFRLVFLFTGDHSAGLHHCVNAVVHAVCSLLVYEVATKLFDQHEEAQQERENPQDVEPLRATQEKTSAGALITGLLFAVHPIHCDAVASIVGRADLLCTSLSLLAFLMYVKTRVVAAVILTIAAGLCKELGFTNFAVLVVYDLLRLHAHMRVDPTLRRLKLRVWTVVAVGAVAALVRVWINGEHRQGKWNILANNIVGQESRLTRILSYAHVHAWYLWKLVWPRWLCFDYGYNTIPVIESVADARNLYTLTAYLVVVAGLRTAALQLHLFGGNHATSKPSCLLMMSIAFGVIPFIPASNLLFPVGTVVAERLLYFPSVGFCLLVGSVGDHALKISRKYGNQTTSSAVSDARSAASSNAVRKSQLYFRVARWTVVCCGSLLLLIASYRSYLRNSEWVSEEALFKAAVQLVPTNVKVLSNEAKALLHVDAERALDYLKVSFGMMPTHLESNLNMGLTYASLAADSEDRDNLFLSSIRHLYKATVTAPGSSSGPGFLGTEIYKFWRMTKGERPYSVEKFLASETMRSAKSFLDDAIELKSVSPAHFYSRGNMAFDVGHYDEAMRFYRMTQSANEIILKRQVDLELLIESSHLFNMIGVCYYKKNELEPAIQVLLEGLALYPKDTQLSVNAAVMMRMAGYDEEAERQLEAAVAAATEPGHIATLRELVPIIESNNFHGAAKAFLERADELERTFSE